MRSTRPRAVRLGEVYGTVIASAPCRDTRVWEFDYAPGQKIPVHEHAAPYVCYLAAGELVELNDRETTVYSQSRLVYHPRGMRHQGGIGAQGARALGFELSLRQLSRDGIHPSSLPSRPLAITDPSLLLLMDRVALALRCGARYGKQELDEAVAEVSAALTEGRAPVVKDGHWLRLVLEFINDEFKTTPQIDDFSRVAGLHPTHLMRAFKQKTGMTLGDYVRRLKIAHACRQLRADGMPLAQIAAECGFADQSHFSRTFKAVMGLTPLQYRRLTSN